MTVPLSRPSAEPPDDEVGDRILAAALELLRARGPRAVTMQAVTQATGIAKTTIYRRHSDRGALLTAALEQLVDQSEPCPHTAPEQRLRWAITQSIEVIRQGIGVGGFAALLTDEDPDFTADFRRVLTAYRVPAVAALGCGEAIGQTAVDMIVGSYIAEFGRTGTVSADWSERVFALLRAGLCP